MIIWLCVCNLYGSAPLLECSCTARIDVLLIHRDEDNEHPDVHAIQSKTVPVRIQDTRYFEQSTCKFNLYPKFSATLAFISNSRPSFLYINSVMSGCCFVLVLSMH